MWLRSTGGSKVEQVRTGLPSPTALRPVRAVQDISPGEFACTKSDADSGPSKLLSCPHQLGVDDPPRTNPTTGVAVAPRGTNKPALSGSTCGYAHFWVHRERALGTTGWWRVGCDFPRGGRVRSPTGTPSVPEQWNRSEVQRCVRSRVFQGF